MVGMEKTKNVQQLLPIPGSTESMPTNSQDLYLGSLRAIGLNPQDHDIRFVEDDWESLFGPYRV